MYEELTQVAMLYGKEVVKSNIIVYEQQLTAYRGQQLNFLECKAHYIWKKYTFNTN